MNRQCARSVGENLQQQQQQNVAGNGTQPAQRGSNLKRRIRTGLRTGSFPLQEMSERERKSKKVNERERERVRARECVLDQAIESLSSGGKAAVAAERDIETKRICWKKTPGKFAFILFCFCFLSLFSLSLSLSHSLFFPGKYITPKPRLELSRAACVYSNPASVCVWISLYKCSWDDGRWDRGRVSYSVPTRSLFSLRVSLCLCVQYDSIRNTLLHVPKRRTLLYWFDISTVKNKNSRVAKLGERLY